MYITKKEYFKELEDMGFYLEGNTYKYKVGKYGETCIAICTIDRKILTPKMNVFDKIISKFIKNCKKNNTDKILIELWNRNLINNI